ncbi:MAG: 50S ribosomal protein L11 methyltransferase, partial [Candidatus Binatia bacterium]
LHRRVVITIKPGMAFGTGTHFTTRSCLEFIEEVCSSRDGKHDRALDVGTGSGILAIALAKMGVKEVLALDNDLVALGVARSNVRSNRVREFVRLSAASPAAVKGAFTLLAANLVAETIIDLAHVLKRRVCRNGYLILSGILKPKVRDVLRRFTPAPFVLLREKADKEWVTLLLRKER